MIAIVVFIYDSNNSSVDLKAQVKQYSVGNGNIQVDGESNQITIQQNNDQKCSKIPQIEQDMDYEIGVQIIKNAGWQAADVPAYGYQDDHPKVLSECSGNVEMCNNYPELESCGSGYCKMRFWDCEGQVLTLSTYGELGNGAYIRWWEIK